MLRNTKGSSRGLYLKGVMTLIKSGVQRFTLSSNMKIIWFLLVPLTCLSGTFYDRIGAASDAERSTIASAQQATRPFTVADDIELTRFGFDATKAIRFSPDGNYYAVYAERGRLDLNRVEDSLRFYRSEDVENFLKHSDESQPPSCVWVVTRSHKDANGGDGIIR